MKPLKITNEYGKTIEIKFNDDGIIKIRHSEIDSKAWAELREYDKEMRHASLQSFMLKKGIDLNSPEVKEMAKSVAGRMGGYVFLRGDTHMVNAEEVALIHAAVKQAGGIVPNWSRRP